MSLERLQADDFSKCLNQTFRIHIAHGASLEVELIQVSGLTPADDAPDRRQPFSLLFRGPAEVTLEQGIFKIENETLGELELFVVTIGPDDEGMRHEVVFS